MTAGDEVTGLPDGIRISDGSPSNEDEYLNTVYVDFTGQEYYLGQVLAWWEGICGTGLRRHFLGPEHVTSSGNLPDLSTIPPPFPWDRNEEIVRRRDHYLKAKETKARMRSADKCPRTFADWADRVEGPDRKVSDDEQARD